MLRTPSASPGLDAALLGSLAAALFGPSSRRAKKLLSCIGQDRANESSHWRTPRKGPFLTHGDNCRMSRGKRVARKRSRGARSKTHSCATTTPSVRRAIQASEETNTVLAKRHGVNRKTIAKWKARESISDERMGPKNPRAALLTSEDEAIILAYR
jgi:hypothetical protein